MKEIEKITLTFIIVILTLGVIGADSWLIFSQIVHPVIPSMLSIIISSILTLFIYKLLSNMKPKEKDDKLVDINTISKTIDSSKHKSDSFDISNNSDESKKSKLGLNSNEIEC